LQRGGLAGGACIALEHALAQGVVDER
jgi:hypothetical protein